MDKHTTKELGQQLVKNNKIAVSYKRRKKIRDSTNKIKQHGLAKDLIIGR